MSEAHRSSEMRDAVCPACSCLCDDIEMGRDPSGEPVFKHVCGKGRSFFTAASGDSPAVYYVGSDSVTMAVAVQAAADLLKQAQMPLVTGLSGVGMECQQVALQLARRISGVVDIDGNPDRSRQFAFQRTGGVTATLGEVRNRADRILFWCFDPTESHPRLLERCSVESKKIIVVGPTDWTSGRADHFVELDPGFSNHAIATCHAVGCNLALDPGVVVETTGVPLSQWNELIEVLGQQDSVACFVGESGQSGSSLQTFYDRMAQWAGQMNSKIRFFCLFPHQLANRLAAEDVLAMNTGFPSAVNLSRQQPEFSFLEYATQTLLERQETDAIMLLSSAGLDQLNQAARGQLNQIPKILLLNWREFESLGELELNEGDVRVGMPTIAQGDWARMDNVLLPVRNGTDTESEVTCGFLEALLNQV